MGGTVAVSVRKPDGSIVNMHRWTNIFPYALFNVDFLYAHFDEWYSDFTKTWLDMKADYEKNKDTGHFELNMTDVYFPSPEGLAPVDYGIIVIDFLKHKVYSSQNYCHLNGTIALNKIIDDEEFIDLLVKLHKEGKIKFIKKDVYKNGFHEEILYPLTCSPEIFEDNLKSLYLEFTSGGRQKANLSSVFCDIFEEDDPFNFRVLQASRLRFQTDTQWIYHHYSGSESEGVCLALLKKQMKKDNWPFSDVDHEGWNESFDDFLENYQENDPEEYDKLKTILSEINETEL
jgi:hypothetical protein